MATPTPQQITQDLLGRAHSPDSVSRIYNDKIQHRTLHLRPTSPPPSVVNARAARRLFLPREKRQLGLYDIPKDGQKYSIYAPLNNLWQGYAQEILGSDVFRGGPNAAAKLASAELQGAFAEVVKCTCPSRVGIKGIIVRDRKYVLEVVMERNGLKTIPKEGTTFRIKVESPDASDMEKSEPFIFDVLGDQLMLRSADRANRKFKTHFLTTL